ncbi:HAD-IIIC family phosphatase [Kitasatospora sp. NPDC004669]|uniref:HAD-IIIC family phosphatase n=1 Tax=Kitasatospora sp. NPDC004669 TaxID=3154555 RepID=UPI0033AF8DC9
MTALDQIRVWNAEGRLAEQYPGVLSLIRLLDADARASVGQLLARLDAEKVQRLHPQTPTSTVAITGHSTLTSLIAPLTGEFARHGMLLRPRVSDYNAYARDLQDPGSEVYLPDTDLVLCLLDAEAVFDDMLSPWRLEHAEEALRSKLAQLNTLAATYAAHGAGTLVLNTVPLLPKFTHQLVDLRSRARLGVAWREFNAGLLRLGETHANSLVLDLEPLVAVGGPVADPRFSCYVKARLSEETLGAYAVEVGHLARALTGRAKKVLVLDADNTLWDGILGDDGPEGIAIGGSFRGEAFAAFQKVCKQIGSQGVMLAICSKNDREQVLGVLREHPEMVLREDDFVNVTANWQPKDENLETLAQRLNLGTDSFVFADDSTYECGLVEAGVSGVAVVRLNDEPALHVDRLLADGWFDVRELTEEDRARADRYQVEELRQEFLAGAGSTEEYLAGLEVRVGFGPPKGVEATRVAQITQRTNQFNLTTRRLQPQTVRERLADPGWLVLAIRSGDRFGDNGIVGAVFAQIRDDGLHLDNFLLSCRVFARGIEQACLSALLQAAREAGLPAVWGEYRPTAKNHRMRDFYPHHGFAEVGERDGRLLFRHPLDAVDSVPAHVALDTDLPALSVAAHPLAPRH